MSEPAVMSIFPKVNTTTCISINMHVPGVCNKLAVVFSEYYYPQTIAWQQKAFGESKCDDVLNVLLFLYSVCVGWIRRNSLKFNK